MVLLLSSIHFQSTSFVKSCIRTSTGQYGVFRSYSKHGLTNLKGRKVAAQNWLIRQSKDPYVKRAREENYRCRSAFKLLELDDKYDFLRPGGVVIDLGAAPGSWTQVAVNRVNALHVDKAEPRGLVISVDIQHMFGIDGATVLSESDFTQQSVQQTILTLLNESNKNSMGMLRANKSSSEIKSEPTVESLMYSGSDTVKEGSLNASSSDSDKQSNDGVSSRSLMQCRAGVLLSDMAPPPSGLKSHDHQLVVRLAAAVLRFSILALDDGGTCLIKLWRGSELDKLVMIMQKCFAGVQVVKPPSSRSDSSEVFILAQGFHV